MNSLNDCSIFAKSSHWDKMLTFTDIHVDASSLCFKACSKTKNMADNFWACTLDITPQPGLPQQFLIIEGNYNATLDY